MKKPRKNYKKIKKLNQTPTWLIKNKKFNDRFVTQLVEDLSKHIANNETLTMQRLSEVVQLYQDTKQKRLLNIIYSNLFGWILMYLLNVKRKYQLSQNKFEELFGDVYMVLERCCENYKPSNNNTFLSYYRMCVYWIVEHTILKHKDPLDVYSLSYIDNIKLENDSKIVNIDIHKDFEENLEMKLMLSNVFNYIVEYFDDNELLYFLKQLEKSGIPQGMFVSYIKSEYHNKIDKLINKRIKIVDDEEMENRIFKKLNDVFQFGE